MPTQYNGFAAPLLTFLPTAKNIASSTNASPIVVTTDTPHQMTTGDSVQIEGHLVNTAADGVWAVQVVTATKYKLIGSTGNGVGASTGTSRSCAFGSTYSILTDGMAPKAATWRPSLEGLGDRTALLRRKLHFELDIFAGGYLRINQRAGIYVHGGMFLRDMSVTTCDNGATITGRLQAEALNLSFDTDCQLDFNGTSVVNFHSTSIRNDRGKINLFDTTVITSDSAAFYGVLVVGDGTIPNDGNLTITDHSQILVQNGGRIQMSSGAFIAGTTLWTGNLTLDDGMGIDCQAPIVMSHIGRIVHKLKDVPNDNGTVSLSISDGTIVHLSSDGIDATLNLDFSTTGAQEGDMIFIYSIHAPTSSGKVVLKSGGSTFHSSPTGGTSSPTYGAIIVFGGSAWRHLLATDLRTATINNEGT